MPPYSTRVVDALRLPDGFTETDVVAVEEPLEIRIGGEPVAVTMRTPGHDEELALGFCVTEGLEPVSARVPDDLAANAVEVEAGGFDPERLRRHFYTSSSCGVCGKGAIEAVQVSSPRVESSLEIAQAVVASLPGRLREAQHAFAATGGLHATGLFDAAGELLCVREDVGRHNAMDKVVGWAFSEGVLPLSAHVLCVSGRLSFELVQKAAVAGCPVLVAVGAPSSLAVELAADRGVTLCGWVRDGRVTVYSEPWRIVVGAVDRRTPRRRRVRAVRLIEGARVVSRRDARRARMADPERHLRRGRRRRKGRRRAVAIPRPRRRDGGARGRVRRDRGTSRGDARDVCRPAGRRAARHARRSSASWPEPARSRRRDRFRACTRRRCFRSWSLASHAVSCRCEA